MGDASQDGHGEGGRFSQFMPRTEIMPRLGGWSQVARMSTCSGCLVGQRLARRQHGCTFLITSTLVFCSKECLGFLGKCLSDAKSHLKCGKVAAVKLCGSSSASAYRSQSSGTHGGSLGLRVPHEPQVLCSVAKMGCLNRQGGSCTCRHSS